MVCGVMCETQIGSVIGTCTFAYFCLRVYVGRFLNIQIKKFRIFAINCFILLPCMCLLSQISLTFFNTQSPSIQCEVWIDTVPSRFSFMSIVIIFNQVRSNDLNGLVEVGRAPERGILKKSWTVAGITAGLPPALNMK